MTTLADVHARAAELTAGWSPEQKAALVARLEAEARRLRFTRDHPGPLETARALNPRLTVTPALEAVSAAMEWAITTPGARLVVSMPPQEGKTTLVRHAELRALQLDPGVRIAHASYGLDLARTSGRYVRQLIEAYGTGAVDPASGLPLPDRLGIAVRRDHAAASDWQITTGEGGMYSIGVGGGLTGRPVDLLIVDDPIKDQVDADSARMRERLHDWWSSVSETRLAPAASVIVIQTRWHEHDLAGHLITADQELPEEDREWRVVNIPALADGDTLDQLDRPAGTWLESARRRTTAQWERIRRRVGERVFAALYQGRPAPLAGGIFKQAWFDGHRVTEHPKLSTIAVCIDPADTGTGDEAGMLVGGSTGRDKYVLADLSGNYSQAEWARRACLAALQFEATRLVQERNLGNGTALRDAWSLLRRQAAALHGTTDVPAAQAKLMAAGDTAAADPAQLEALVPMVGDILDAPSAAPCHIEYITPKQSKKVRADQVTQFFELGTARLVGRLAKLEFECVTWQEGQQSPNRLDTLAHLIMFLDRGAKVQTTVNRSTGARVPTRTGQSRAAR